MTPLLNLACASPKHEEPEDFFSRTYATCGGKQPSDSYVDLTNWELQSLTKGSPNVVLIRPDPQSRRAIGTFDYSDLNAYLLLVVGLARPDVAHLQSFNELAKKGREGKMIPVKDIKDFGRREPVVVLPNTSYLSHAVEMFGSGVHRILIAEEGSQDIVGILTQLRLVRFFWENGRDFQPIDKLFPGTLMDLRVGSKAVRSIKYVSNRKEIARLLTRSL